MCGHSTNWQIILNLTISVPQISESDHSHACTNGGGESYIMIGN
jgi:hypothetical protein